MWCMGKSDNLETIGRGNLVVLRSQVGGSNNVVHVEVAVLVLSHRRQTRHEVIKSRRQKTSTLHEKW